MEHCTVNKKHHRKQRHEQKSANFSRLLKMKGDVHKVRQHILRGEGRRIKVSIKSADIEERGVKNSEKSADVLYGRPPSLDRAEPKRTAAFDRLRPELSQP